jgi:HD superfamily phosphohydrolase YqeK
VAERVNCLTTTYPSVVSKLIEAHFEMRDNGVLSFFRKHTTQPQNLYTIENQRQY